MRVHSRLTTVDSGRSGNKRGVKRGSQIDGDMGGRVGRSENRGSNPCLRKSERDNDECSLSDDAWILNYEEGEGGHQWTIEEQEQGITVHEDQAKYEENKTFDQEQNSNERGIGVGDTLMISEACPGDSETGYSPASNSLNGYCSGVSSRHLMDRNPLR